jgi:hypothetical protein
MTTSRSASAKQPEAELNSLRLLCNLYSTLAREFMIDLPAQEPEATIEETRTWLKSADERIPVHQLRQFLQTSRLANRETLAAAIDYSLHKQPKDNGDRDKLDFLLVQFLSLSASTQLQDSDASLDFVARTLEPFLGEVEAALPEPLRPLEAQLKSANSCRSLLELYNSGILEQARNLKISLGDRYFEPQMLVATTRFNFLMRRAFFQLMHQDLNAVLEGLRKLEQKGVKALDCRKAEFAEDEPVSRLRMICQSWKVMFQAEYSSGQPLRLLADLRGVVDARLNDISAKSEAAANSEATSKNEVATQNEVTAKSETPATPEAAAQADARPAEAASSVALPAASSADSSTAVSADASALAQKSQAAAAAGNSSKSSHGHKNDRRGRRR